MSKIVYYSRFFDDSFFFFLNLGWLVALSAFTLFLFCLRENGRMMLHISHQFDTIERLQDRIEYLEESLYEFY
jgi:hypothetical protein